MMHTVPHFLRLFRTSKKSFRLLCLSTQETKGQAFRGTTLIHSRQGSALRGYWHIPAL